MKAMVLAAGVGSRLEPLTTQVPKPMVPIANIPVMQHILQLLKRHGFEDVISNLHYEPQKIADYFGDGKAFGMNLHFHLERELSGDAGGVRACRQFLEKETFIVMMGDLLTDADLGALVAEHKSKKAIATIAIKQVDDVSHFGVALTDKDGFITGFQEKPKAEEALSHSASTGIYILEPEVFDYIPWEGSYGFGRQLFPQLVEKGLPVLGASIDRHYWSDVGTIEQYRYSNFDALQNSVHLDIPGVRRGSAIISEGALLDAQVQMNGSLLLGKNSIVEPNVRIEGRVIIGENCRIESGAVLDETIIWSDTTVGAGAKLTNSIIASNCHVPANSEQHMVVTVDLIPALSCGVAKKEPA